MIKFKMTKKWINAKSLSKDFMLDFYRLSDFVTSDYKKLGFDAFLVTEGGRTIDFSIGIITNLGFIETQKILKITQTNLVDGPKPIFLKQKITVYAIYLLLFKYGYVCQTEEEEQDVVQEAQLQLINLNII